MSLETLRRVLKEEAEAVARLADRLDDTFIRAVDMIEKCNGRVITCGVGKSGQGMAPSKVRLVSRPVDEIISQPLSGSPKRQA